MVFEGLSRKLGLRLIELEQSDFDLFTELDNNEVVLQILYKDAFYLLRFLEIISDNIKKTHRTLSFILRNQYRNTSSIFNTITESLKINLPIKEKYKILLDRISNLKDFDQYYRDVLRFIILPVLKKYNIYSPNLVYMIFMDLLFFMIGSYHGYEIQDENRNFIRNYVSLQSENEIQEIVWLKPVIKTMMKDELQLWKNLKQIHKRPTKSSTNIL